MKLLSILIFIGSSACTHAMYLGKTAGLSDQEATQYSQIDDKIALKRLQPVDLAFVPNSVIKLVLSTHGEKALYAQINEVIEEANTKEDEFFSAKNHGESERKYLLAMACLRILELGRPTEVEKKEFSDAKEALDRIKKSLDEKSKDSFERLTDLAQQGDLFIEEEARQSERSPEKRLNLYDSGGEDLDELFVDDNGFLRSRSTAKGLDYVVGIIHNRGEPL